MVVLERIQRQFQGQLLWFFFFFFSSTCVGFCFPCFFIHHPVPLLPQSKAPREEGADFRIWVM